jgi:thioredoxin reductase (NADPH)
MEKQKEIKTRSAEMLIIGGGAAGLSAAIYAARAGRKTVVLEGRASSRLKLDYSVENYPGFISIDSAELLQKFRDHAQHFGAEIIGGEAIAFSLASDPKYVTTRDALYEGQAVIVASGKPIPTGRMIPGEAKMLGMGVSYCSTCDGPLYRGRRVAAIGNSDEAAEDILALEQMGCEVHWFLEDQKGQRVSEALLSEVKKKGIAVYESFKVKKIKGEGRVEAVVFEKDMVIEELGVYGVFIFREEFSASLLSNAGLELDHRQCISVDRFQQTSLEGVFAAGDITCGGMQIVSAAGEGCVAAMQAIKYLRKSDK